MSITSLRGSTLPNKSFRAGRAKTRDVVTIAPDTATTFANGAAISAGGGGGGGPTISNVSVTDSGYILSNATPYIDSTGGFIKITGTGFAAGCTVYVGGNAASSTTFISSTEVRAQVGAASSNAQAVYVVNTDNSVGILLNAITYSGTPSWSTGATLSSQIADISFSIALSATSDSSIVYTVASGSSTPSGTTLYSNGVFAGTVTGISSDTNYSFTAVATDVENQLSSRAFTVSVAAGDASFYITPLLLSGDANVWITDSSTNKFSPSTIAADTKPTAFSPYNTNWSAYFDGTGDYLAFSTYNTTFGSGDFTVECWVYMPVITNTYSSGIIGTTNYNGVVDRGWALDIIGATGCPRFYLYNSSGTGVTLNSSTLLPANRWTHLAAVRSGTTVTIYMNGASIASGTNATSDNFSAPIYVATIATSFAVGVSTYSYAGYISNARIVVGTAVYTGNFTPQTTSLTSTQSSGSNIAAISSGTSLLTLQNNRFVDNSTNAFAITRNGGAAIRSFGPFTETDVITGSAYFDGSGDYLYFPSNSAYTLGTNDHCIEFWIYPDGAQAQYANPWFYNGSIVYYFSVGSDSNEAFLLVGGGSPWSLAITILNAEYVKILNNWVHVVITRSGTAFRVFFNGRLVGYGTTAQSIAAQTSAFSIGWDGTNATTYYKGWLTDFRLINGSIPAAYQTSSTTLGTTIFTPPTSSLSSVANTVLLTLQYRLSENNHRFVDEGGNKYLVTRGGNASQGSFSPFSPAGWSGYFNGSSDSLTVPAGTDFAYGTGDFTVEGWFYATSTLAAYGSMLWSQVASGHNYFYVAAGEGANPVVNNYIQFIGAASGGGTTIYSSTTFTLNTWNHFAAVRISGSVRVYLNGVGGTSTSNTTDFTNTSYVPNIGRYTGGTSWFPGYISNLRVVKGVGVYTGNFTPPTTALTATQSAGTNIAAITAGQTVFLGLQNNRFIDNSATPKTISVGGTSSVRAFSPFRPSGSYSPTLHGGSAYFDGTGDYITTVSTTSTILPTSTTNTFTIDGWLYPTALGALKWIFGDMQPAGGTNNVSVDISSSNFIELYWYDGGVKRATSTTAVVLNQWNYFAIVVNNNAITIYVNSTTAGQGGTTTLTTRSLGTSGWALGAWNSSDYYSGYMSSIRWTNGVARTISSIPTAPPSLDANTSVLMNFTHGGVVDATGRVNFETLADTKVSNVTSKFGLGSLSFDGTGDYLFAPSNPAFAFGTGDLTIECWVNFNSTAGTFVPFAQSDALGSSTNDKWFFALGSSTLRLQTHSSGGFTCTTPWTPSTGIWYHIAAVRSSGTILLFINGTSGTVTTTGTPSGYSLSQNGLSIGAMSTPYHLNGYIDDLRITRFARYTSAFTAPTRAHLTK